MITTFGEIMLRISPGNPAERITQATHYRTEPGGSESNVAIALSNLGLNANFVTSLPDNPLSHKILQHLKQFDVETAHIKLKGERIGVYWTETGIGPRNSYVIYDRDQSAFSQSTYDDYNWKKALEGSKWFHFSGISPAVSQNVANLLKKVIAVCSCPYSVDLNFRGKLWNWAEKKQERINEIMTGLCSGATLIAGNETDFMDIFNIQASGKNEEENYKEIAEKCFSKFEDAKYISISNRKSLSATQNEWNGFLFVKDDETFSYKGMTYRLDSIQDRVGTGDSFVAGIIYGLYNKETYNFQDTVDFAVTLAALNHTTRGDASTFSSKDVVSAMHSKGSGRIVR